MHPLTHLSPSCEHGRRIQRILESINVATLVADVNATTSKVLIYTDAIRLKGCHGVAHIFDETCILLNFVKNIIVVRNSRVSQAIHGSQAGIQTWRNLGMYLVKHWHHEPRDLLARVVIVVDALGQPNALLISVIDPGQACLYSVAGVMHGSVDLSKGSHLFFVRKQAVPRGP